MDPVPITIIVIAFILTALIIFLSVQVWYILKEIRVSLQKANKMLDDFGNISGVMSDSATGLAGLVSGLRAGFSVMNLLQGKKEKEKEDDHE